MPHDPKTLATLAIVALFAAVNLWELAAPLVGKLKLLSLARKPTSAGPSRTPGEVLDCLNADLTFCREHTDAPPEALKAFDVLAPYLMHVKPAADSSIAGTAEPTA